MDLAKWIGQRFKIVQSTGLKGREAPRAHLVLYTAGQMF